MIRILVAAFAFAALGSAHAQVYKCVDGSGRITYQQDPCAKTERGARVDILPENGSTREPAALEAQWVAAAKNGQVTTGMPKKYVRDAYGAPAQVLGASASDRVSEVWVFRGPGGTRRVGFLDGRVVFERLDEAPSTPLDDSVPSVARADATSMVAARRNIAIGRDCGSVIDSAGRPDRSEGIQVPGANAATPGMRHVYDDDGSAPPAPMAFTCVNGLVYNVERSIR